MVTRLNSEALRTIDQSHVRLQNSLQPLWSCAKNDSGVLCGAGPMRRAAREATLTT